MVVHNPQESPFLHPVEQDGGHCPQESDIGYDVILQVLKQVPKREHWLQVLHTVTSSIKEFTSGM